MLGLNNELHRRAITTTTVQGDTVVTHHGNVVIELAVEELVRRWGRLCIIRAALPLAGVLVGIAALTS